jgi:hypothetical protein
MRRRAASLGTLGPPPPRKNPLHGLLFVCIAMATVLNPKISNAVLSSPTPARAKRCHRPDGRKMRKSFSAAAILQNGAAGDEWIFRVSEFYSGALHAWQV